MKRYVYSTADLDEPKYIPISRIVSITLVDDARTYSPRDYVFASSTSKDYNMMTYDQLMELPKRERDHIHDVRVLRKLKLTDLSEQQRMKVKKANAENFTSNIKQVKEALQKLQNCGSVYLDLRNDKNNSFEEKIRQLGGRFSNDDVWDIVDQLHVKDYTESTLSFLDKNWNALLMVFEFKGEHTFRPRKKDGEPVTVNSLDIYIKVDVENRTGDGYAVLSFHEPEFKMNHPYADYPIDKESMK